MHGKLFRTHKAGWFLQAGMSNPKVSQISRHIGAGVQWYNVFARDGHITGVCVSHIQTSRFLHQINDMVTNNELLLSKTETAFEVFYRYQINEYFAIKPNFQYVLNPASQANIDNASVLTLRLEGSF